MITNLIKKYVVESTTCVLFIIYATLLNLQFLEGANVNYTFSGHDEYLTVREVFSILNPASFKHFFMGIVAGDVLFYGRMMFYVDAFFAFLPFKMFGINGLVFSIRMMHVLYLFFGLAILARTFLKNEISRAVFYLVVLTWYYSAYFIMIPKPEPLQLLVLAMFLYFGLKNNWAYGKHFILLGLGYGLKFNVLMILPLFFLLPFFTKQFNFKNAFLSGIYFFAGVLIAVPALLLSPIKPVFLKGYLQATFGNTKHYDDSVTTVSGWLSDGLFKFYSGNSILGVVVLIVFFVSMMVSFFHFIKKKQIPSSLIVSLVGFCLLAPVILLTNRLWSHYLWTGSVFMMLGLIAFLDSSLYELKRGKWIQFSVYLIFLVISASSLSLIKPLFSLNEKSKEITQNSTRAYRYLKEKQKAFTVIQDISVGYPYQHFLEVGRYHPFADPYPYTVPTQKFYWVDFINPKTIETNRANYIITYKRNFETSVRQFKTAKDIMEGYSDSLMRTELGKTIFLDTLFDKVRIYKVNNGN